VKQSLTIRLQSIKCKIQSNKIQSTYSQTYCSLRGTLLVDFRHGRNKFHTTTFVITCELRKREEEKKHLINGVTTITTVCKISSHDEIHRDVRLNDISSYFGRNFVFCFKLEYILCDLLYFAQLP